MSETKKELVERLAVVFHEAWVHWSNTIAMRENLSKERVERWQKLWVPYDELSEEYKEHDRQWARKAIEFVSNDLLELRVENAVREGFYKDLEAAHAKLVLEIIEDEE
jgi:hypothetical protein